MLVWGTLRAEVLTFANAPDAFGHHVSLGPQRCDRLKGRRPVLSLHGNDDVAIHIVSDISHRQCEPGTSGLEPKASGPLAWSLGLGAWGPDPKGSKAQKHHP